MRDETKAAYEELNLLIQRIVEMENAKSPDDSGVQDSHFVSEWAVAVGVMTFGSDGYESSDVDILAPQSCPMWRVTGLFKHAETQLGTIESHNLMASIHQTDEGDEEE